MVQIGVVVSIHPGTGRFQVDEFEAQRTHSAMGRVADGVELRTGDPEWRMWFL